MPPVLLEIGPVVIRSNDFFGMGGVAAGLIFAGSRARAAGLRRWKVVPGGAGVVWAMKLHRDRRAAEE
ncbi:MAG: hypothetical protein E3J64_03285 [Anaerolineales bacterium]|nr:MAG: hypothetical protein E3J64_03285 [Anaerolineales bacterium]